MIIEWPAPGKQDSPYYGAMPGWKCAIFDAETGKPVNTVQKIAIPAVTADAVHWVTCWLTMDADDDGKPVLFPEPSPGKPGSVKICVDGDGKVRTGTFPFLVSEMRIRQ